MEYRMTIIIPVFNEIDNLDRIHSTFTDYFLKSKTKSKVLFIDDGSTDGSFNKIEEICNGNPDFEFLKFKENCGLSAAIKAGIDHIETELIGYIDADLQTTPYDFDILLADIDNYQAVIGFRGKRKDTLNKKIQSLIANSIRRGLINDGIIDTGCPLKVIHSDVAKKIPFFKGMHRFIPALILLQNGKIKQIKVQHFERIAGQSKFNIFNRSLKALRDTFGYRWMRRRYINYTIEKSKIGS
ncbi:glycosyltransferase family 2 protein [Aureibaculum sp. 2210JD6-5]|uniref:glycosyltransferase family 2 protein n=1 Tax=Aureibaculum sp. 2210JD6-5 TaxID=3103957 RepID=UPI002AAE61CE|nr:glycosyltransferase family 2 protein [Aureibaculum sp. 2210JD6-5]MDY7393670.1 glycosyltransferase family 2 protein [Aureibaculum sp. 2210JD6-5]